MGVGARIGDHDDAWLFERTGDVVREITRSEATSNGRGTSVCRKLENSTLAVWAGRDDSDVRWVVNGDEDTSGQYDLLPGDECQ